MTSRMMGLVLAIALFASSPCGLLAQTSPVPPGTSSSVDGRVVHPRQAKLAPVGGVWVTIHRVASDTAGPLDSARVGADGRFRFSYKRTGTADAVYFVSAMYDGIAYFSRPLTTAHVSGDDATIVVFDTTSIAFPLAIKGRHIIVSSPSVDGSRQVVEAYEIANESDQTLVSPDDAHPSWSAPLPPGAANVQAGESDISAAAISASNGRLRVTAPMAPGLKQLSISYTVPQSAFPLHVPLEQSATVLELLLEEPKAQARGASLKAVAPATIERRVFQRYLGADAPAGASIDIEVPVIHAAQNVRVYWWIAGALAALMAAGLGAWYARARGRNPIAAAGARARVPDSTELLAREIASLDAEFERNETTDAAARAAYEERRRTLKRQLASALDASAPPT
ncbi:MAG: hypothetical protein ABI889_09915 [Gemmatimonadota bacterium]